MGKADIGGKRVLGTAPETWVRWLLKDPNLEVKATLTEEFRFVLRHSDELLLVQGEKGSFLVLTELQLHRDLKMGLRMRAYAGLAEQKYELPVYPVVLLLLPPEEEVAGYYHSEFMGLVAHQDYRVVKAWAVDAREVLKREVLALVPYVPLMEGANEAVIREGVALLRRRGVGEEMEVVLALFASFVMEPEQIQKIVRWDMAVLRESPWYQEILQEGRQEGWQQGRQEGWQQGRQEGWQQGRQEGARQGILRLLKVRFDLATEVMEELAEQLQALVELPVLEDLLVAAVQVESLDSFRVLLAEAGRAEKEKRSLSSDGASLARSA